MKKQLIEARLKFLAGIITENEYNTILKESEILDKILDKISAQGINSLSSEEKEYLNKYSEGDIDDEKEDNNDYQNIFNNNEDKDERELTFVSDTDLEDSFAVDTLYMSDNSNANRGIAFQTKRGMQLLKQATKNFNLQSISDLTPEVVQAFYEFDDKTYGDLYNESSIAVFTLLKALTEYFPRDKASYAITTASEINPGYGYDGYMDGPAAFVDNKILKLNIEQLADILKKAGVNVIPHSKLLNAFVMD
jgi:succinate dehydrogenase flavin-adding protein (antitoxin of CptAB toxin-antitoxin module)